MYWEIKKILSRKSVWCGICFLIIYAIYLFYFDVRYSENSVTDTGDVIVGKEAILMNQAYIDNTSYQQNCKVQNRKIKFFNSTLYNTRSPSPQIIQMIYVISHFFHIGN